MLRAVGRGLVTIFTLHRFTDPEHGIVGHDPDALAKQLAYLRRHRYRLLGLSDVVERIAGRNGHSTSPAVVFTVDDGYGDFARIGARVFAEYDCPVTVFIPTGFLDGRLWLWWDRVTYLFANARRASFLTPELGDRSYQWSTPEELARVQQYVLDALERVPAPQREAAIAALSRQLEVKLPETPPAAYAPMSWDDVRKMARQGVTFGPHTVTHPILPLTPDDICKWEIEESYRRLRLETSSTVPVFCYPAGHAGRRELQAVQSAGFSMAVTTIPGYAAPHGIRDWGALRRFALPRFPTAEDRPHLVNVVAGLARLRPRIRRPRPRDWALAYQ
jgi:peptidoglycan/xylan/chitin deacetylase (PgdA/CDA1 family)